MLAGRFKCQKQSSQQINGSSSNQTIRHRLKRYTSTWRTASYMQPDQDMELRAKQGCVSASRSHTPKNNAAFNENECLRARHIGDQTEKAAPSPKPKAMLYQPHTLTVAAAKGMFFPRNRR